jgi:predicted transcriptional regulator with HTH domain
MSFYDIKGPQLSKKIWPLASYKDYTFATYVSDIAVFTKTDPVGKLLCYLRPQLVISNLYKQILYLLESLFIFLCSESNQEG